MFARTTRQCLGLTVMFTHTTRQVHLLLHGVHVGLGTERACCHLPRDVPRGEEVTPGQGLRAVQQPLLQLRW
jgi:hypothetical protein